MPRPVSWLPRLQAIVRHVANSPRSHYDRKDLETVFELQPRAAQKLLELLPTLQLGTSRLVDREVLLGFLERVRDTSDTIALFEQIRAEKAAVSRRKPRTLIRRDDTPVSLASLPESIGLSRGRLEVSFRSVEQLAESLYALARLLEAKGEEFARAFEQERPSAEPEDAGEVGRMFTKLEQMGSQRARRSIVEEDKHLRTHSLGLRTPCRKLQDRLHLLPRHPELVHQLIHAHVL